MNSLYSKKALGLPIVFVFLFLTLLSACQNDSGASGTASPAENTTPSSNASANDNGTDTTPPTVTASITTGVYTAGQTVTLSCNDSGSGCSAIYYTTDGNAPTNASTKFTAAIPLTAGVITLKFIAVDKAGNTSAVATETYTVDSGTSGKISAFVIPKTGFSDARVAVDQYGVVHAVYAVSGSLSTVEYARCASLCGQASSWKFTVLVSISDFVQTSPRMVVEPNGRVHIVYDNNSKSSTSVPVYLTCASDCLDAAKWQKTELPAYRGAWATWRSSPMTVDANGRVYFIAGNGGGTSWLFSCASDCTNANSWGDSELPFAVSRIAMVATNSSLHLVFGNKSETLFYGTCTAACLTWSNWSYSPALAYYDDYQPIELAANESGKLVVVYNQGNAATAPANVQQYNYHQMGWTCGASCTSLSSWSSLVDFGAEKNAGGIAVATRGNRIVFLSAATDLTAYVCGGSCNVATNWDQVAVDTSQTLDAMFDPYVYPGCGVDGTNQPVRPYRAAWYPDSPQLAILPDNSVVAMHAPYVLRQCTTLTSIVRLGSIGRVVYGQ